MKKNCPRCNGRLVPQTEALQSGRLDTELACQMCGHIEYLELDLARSRREVDARRTRGPSDTKRYPLREPRTKAS